VAEFASGGFLEGLEREGGPGYGRAVKGGGIGLEKGERLDGGGERGSAGKRAVVSASPFTHGIAAYAFRLYSLGFFDELVLFKGSSRVSEEGYERVLKSPLKGTLLVAAHTYLSFYFPSRWGEWVSKAGMVHFTSPDWFHLAKYNKNCYGTVHDLIPLQFPQYHSAYYVHYFRKELESARLLKKVVAISDATKEALLGIYPDLEVARIHQWTEDEFRPRDRYEARKRLGLPGEKKIVLSVGRDSPLKNLKVLPAVMNELEDFLLVRVGGMGSVGAPFKKGNVKVVMGVPRELMPLYYNAADVLVAPGLAEGFDAPVMEAINSGISVVASDIPVHRELTRGRGYLVHPEDAEGWAKAVERAAGERADWSFLGDYYRAKRAKEEYAKLYAGRAASSGGPNP